MSFSLSFFLIHMNENLTSHNACKIRFSSSFFRSLIFYDSAFVGACICVRNIWFLLRTFFRYSVFSQHFFSLFSSFVKYHSHLQWGGGALLLDFATTDAINFHFIEHNSCTIKDWYFNGFGNIYIFFIFASACL